MLLLKYKTMKILHKIWGISLLALLLIVAPHISKAQDEYISEQDFYDELAPYGTWVSDPQYGDVWIPDVAEDFRPYQTRGHWVLTEYGNTWVSDYPWGWATFHYGRWRYDNFYGWEWIPGYEWAPAWVSWRHGGGYYGWAPLIPGMSIGLSVGSNYRVPDSYWAFAPEGYINRTNIYNYYVPHTRVRSIIRNTTTVNYTYSSGGRQYIAGPRAVDIERYTHQRPRVYTINNAARPGAMNVQNNTVSIFRPSVRRNGDARPQRVVDANAYKQQNPNQGIARRGPGGAPGFNHDNAAKLANVARNVNDNNNVVRVNSRPNNDQQWRRPGRPNVQDSRPNLSQPAPTTPTPAQPVQQQPVFNRGGGRNGNDNSPSTNRPNNDLQQKQQQLNDERRTLREQRRQQYQREQQLQSVGQTQQAPAINGQAPLQQQQDAIRGQRRQLQWQQEQQQRAQHTQQVQQQAQQQQVQQQQAQREQQRQAAQQALQQQQRGLAQQQAAQQERAQREQQRQQGQQAQQQQAQQREQQRQQAQQAQAQQQQQQQQAQQREQQRQAQQAAQQQQQAQRQQQQQAQQAQREQQRGQQQQQQQQQQRRPPERVRPN